MKLFWKITALMGMGLILAASIITFPYLPAISPVHDTGEQKEFIRYVEFNPCYAALDRALAEDIRAHEEGMERNWIDTLSYLGAKYGGDFSRYRAQDMDEYFEKLDEGCRVEELTKDMNCLLYTSDAADE